MKPATREHATTREGPASLVLRMRPVVEISPDQLLGLSGINRDLRLESTAGELIFMPPTGTETGDRDSEINMQLRLWTKRNGTGVAFGSSADFVLPNGAIRSPNASWVERSRWTSLTAEQRRRYAPLCPDFVVELLSPSDSLPAAQDKMREYAENGARLGWLIDPDRKRVYVYHPGEPVRELENPEKVSGDPVLPGFALDLREVW